MTTSCTDFEHPYYEQIKKMNVDQVHRFFTEEPKRLAHVFLGEALDFISYGGMNFVVWRLGEKDLAGFINKWIRSQEPRIEYERVPLSKEGNSYKLEETSRKYHYQWNRFSSDSDVELPFINYGKCPENESHKDTARDLAGRLRCAHINLQKFKPSFVKSYTSDGRTHFYQEGPSEPYIDEEIVEEFGEEAYRDEIEEYRKELSKFEDEEPSSIVRDLCYSIISDTGTYLSLETVLNRLSVSDKFSISKNFSAFPFSGFTLANYAKAWWNQKGIRKFYTPRNVQDNFKSFPDFRPFSSAD